MGRPPSPPCVVEAALSPAPPQCTMAPAAEMGTCPGFVWDIVNFLHSIWYIAVFLIEYEDNVDNTWMF